LINNPVIEVFVEINSTNVVIFAEEVNVVEPVDTCEAVTPSKFNESFPLPAILVAISFTTLPAV
jgi:hypothetical protein